MEKESEEHPEQEPQEYYLASRFQTKEEAAVPFYTVQETLRTFECELSGYRLMQQWEESDEKPWYVIVVGLTPSKEVQQELNRALSLGETTSVPQEVIDMLLVRHITETTKGKWVEGHYKKGLQFSQIKFSR